MRAATLLTCLLVSLTPAGAFADEVVLKDGTTLKVQSIKSATPEKVSFRVGGATQSRAAADVSKIYPSGDRNLDRAIRLIKKGANLGKLKPILERAIAKGEDFARPCAQFFLAEALERAGETRPAVKAYDKVAASYPKHFYAPIALQRVARMLGGGGAVSRYEELASGSFGATWKAVGQYGKAMGLVASGQHAKARPVFSRLTDASDRTMQDLARCGVAHCDLLAGKLKNAERGFKQVSTSSKAAGPLGYAHMGLGLCNAKAGKDKAALLSLLRSVLLYPSNPMRGMAAKEGAKLAAKLRLGGDSRLGGMAARTPLSDFLGKGADAEVMRRTLRTISAGIVRELAPALVKKARGREKADLEFLEADALNVIGRSKNDPDLLAKYEQKLKALQKKYPNHPRSGRAGADAFQAAKARALALIQQADREEDPDERKLLLRKGRETFEAVLGPYKAHIEKLGKKAEALLEKASSQDVTPEEDRERQKTENEWNMAELQLADAYTRYAQTFDAGSPKRESNLKKALKLFRDIEERGVGEPLVFYTYLGQADTLLELKKFDESAEIYDQLTYVEPPPGTESIKAVTDDIRRILVRAYYGTVRTLLLAKRADEAYEASKKIDSNKWAKGWELLPEGVQLTFERSKALAGSGRGARGARELFKVIEASLSAPESEKRIIYGLTRKGTAACIALSELSDVTGGEVYAPRIQYYVGIGYFLRGKMELSVAGFKGVLTSAQTKEERREWVPKAVKEIGEILFMQERYLEAALAYTTVFKEFPDHELAENAVRYAVSASKKAIEQFGEDPTDSSGTMVKFARQIESSVGSAAGELYEQKLILKTASDFFQKQRWLSAANEYGRIKPDITNKEGKRVVVPFYANCVANAGYCFFREYRKTKKSEHLKAARGSLALAIKVARKTGDRESEALASYYLGQLENDLKQPDRALKALEPFDGALKSTGRAVGASYEQARAYLKLGKVREAEQRFGRIANKKKDPAYPEFAWLLVSKLRKLAGQAYKKSSNDVEAVRTLRRKAAGYAKAFASTGPLGKRPPAVAFYIGNTLFQGGEYAAAIKVFDEILAKFKRPALKDAKSLDKNESFDQVELYRGYSLVKLERYEEGLEALQKLNATAYVYRGRGKSERALRRGLFVERRLEGPFTFKRAGETYKQKAWFSVLEIGGEKVKYFDTRASRGDSEFFGIEGDDPTGSFDPNSDARTIRMPFKGDYLVVDGLAEATWAVWQKTKDKNFLAKDVSAASNRLIYILRGLESRYGSLTARFQLEPLDFDLRLWRADLRFIRIKMAREDYRGVASDLRLLKLRGRLQKAPAEIRTELEAILAEAEKKGGK